MAHSDYNCCAICDCKMDYSGEARTKQDICLACLKKLRAEDIHALFHLKETEHTDDKTADIPDDNSVVMSVYFAGKRYALAFRISDDREANRRLLRAFMHSLESTLWGMDLIPTPSTWISAPSSTDPEEIAQLKMKRLSDFREYIRKQLGL